jgi:putative transposase
MRPMSQPPTRPTLYKGYRFPAEIISRGVWLYHRFGVSLRDVSDLILARGIEVSHEITRLWTLPFGTEYARRLRRRQGIKSRRHAARFCSVFSIVCNQFRPGRHALSAPTTAR